MKTLNDYGQDVMSAQARVDVAERNIEKTEAALDSLRSDHEKACADLAASREALQAATDRVKAGDYGVEPAAESADHASDCAMHNAPAEEAGDCDCSDDFEGLNRTPPGEPDTQIAENRTLASNGAGF